MSYIGYCENCGTQIQSAQSDYCEDCLENAPRCRTKDCDGIPYKNHSLCFECWCCFVADEAKGEKEERAIQEMENGTD